MLAEAAALFNCFTAGSIKDCRLPQLEIDLHPCRSVADDIAQQDSSIVAACSSAFMDLHDHQAQKAWK